MDKFVKEIELIFTASEVSKQKIKDDLEKIGKAINLSKETSDLAEKAKLVQGELKELKNLLTQYEGIETESARQIRKELEAKIKTYEKALGPSKKDQLKDAAKEFGAGLLETAGQAFLTKLKSLFTDAWNELETMLNFSRLSNPQTRELAFTYGFSASQAYGYQSAMSALGFSSEEDLFFAKKQEVELFKHAFEKYSSKYEKLYDEGTFQKLLEFNVEMKEFQQDLKLEVADFFMQNKDVIKKGLTGIMEIAISVTKILSWLVGSDAASARSAAVSDVISNYQNKTTNVSIDNTFNGIDPSQRQTLVRLGSYTTSQLLAALK